MAKSITGGLGAVNLTIQELRLLEIKTTGIETTDATILNNLTGNNATFSGTVTIENLSIENATVDNLTVNVSLTANDITTSGTITANGNVILNSLPLDNTDNNERYITFQGVGNVLHGDSKLTFNPSSNTLTIIILDVQDINASGTISGTFNIVAENKTGDIDYPISFHDTSTDRVSIGDASYLSSFTFNPSTRTMVLENGQITNATIALGNIAIANITDANINANSRSDDIEYKVVLLRASDDRICEDSSNNITYNPLNERLTVVKTTTTNLKIGQLLTTSNDNFYACMFQGNNNDISQAPLLANFHYNPFQLKLKLDNLDVTNNVTISSQLILTPTVATASTDFNITFLNASDQFRVGGTSRPFTFNPSAGILKSYDLELSNDLSVTGRTDLGSVVSISSLNSVITNTTYPLLTWDNTGGKTIRVDISNLFYDTTTNTLNAPNFSGSFSITAQTRSNGTDYPMLFYDTGTNEICIDSVASNLTYNPSSNLLDVRNINVAVDLDVVGNMTSTDGTFSGDVEADSFILDTGNIFNHSANTYMGLKAISNNGTDLTGFGYNIALWQDGHIRMIARNNQRFYIFNSTSGVTSQRLHITDTTVNVNANLTVDNDATITGDTTITAVNSTVSNNNRIPFIEGGGATGRLCESNLYYNPNNQTLVSANITTTSSVNSPTVTVTGTNNGQLTIDPTYGLFYNHADGHVFRISGTWKLRIDTTLTTIYTDLSLDTGIIKTPNTATDLKLQIAGNDKVVIEDTKTCIKNALCVETCTVPSSSTQFPVLLLNEGTNEIKKADTFMSYDPTLDRIYAKDIMLNDAGTSGRLTLVEPIRYGGVLFYTPLNYTYIIGNTDTIATIDVLGSGLNSGSFGQGIYMGILRTGVKATAFGSNADLWTWNQYISATNTATQFTCNSLITGTWEVTVMCDYTSSSSSGSNRVNPIMRLELNGTEIEEGTQSLYIRHQLGRVGTMRTNYILKLTSGDDIMLRTYLNYAGTTNYSSLLSSGNFTLSNFNFRATYLGPLDEYDRTP